MDPKLSRLARRSSPAHASVQSASQFDVLASEEQPCDTHQVELELVC